MALSTRDVIVNTCGVLAAFLLLGLLANYYCRRLPLRALDEALRQLNAKQEELQLQKAELESQNESFDLGMTTTAEGVETSEQVKWVREEGLTEMQGYVFSPPRPIKDIARFFLTAAPRAATAA